MSGIQAGGLLSFASVESRRCGRSGLSGRTFGRETGGSIGFFFSGLCFVYFLLSSTVVSQRERRPTIEMR